MKYKYELMDSNAFDKDGLKMFILSVNQDFPIRITDKIDIDDFLEKIKKVGNVYCAYDQDKIIGCAFFYANDERKKNAFLTLFAVKKEYRMCGVGSILFDNMVNYCIQLGFENLQLYTHKTNKIARNFYFKRNFYEIDCDRKNDVKLELKLVGRKDL